MFVIICRVTYNSFMNLVECVWGSWTSYGQCNSDTGTQSRTRVKTAVEFGGRCSGSSTESKTCSGMGLHI